MVSELSFGGERMMGKRRYHGLRGRECQYQSEKEEWVIEI